MFQRFKLPCTKRVLKRIIGPTLMKEITAKEPDWRLHFGIAASRLNISEASLMKALADSLGMSWEGFQEPPLSSGRSDQPSLSEGSTTSKWVDSSSPQSAYPSHQLKIPPPLITAFLEQGAFPLFTGTQLCGAICIDPSRLKHLLRLNHRRLIKICSYGRLLTYTAPLVAQINSVASGEQKELEGPDSQEILPITNRNLNQVFKLITIEAEAFNSSSCVITNINNRLTYQFATPEGDIAEGSISSEIGPPLLEYLNICTSGEKKISVEKGPLISVSGGNHHFTLNFHHNHAEKAIKIINDPQKLSETQIPFIIILEDDQIFAKITGLLLQDNGYSHKITMNPFEAISQLRTLDTLPLAIICDLQLPNACGLEFIHTLRNDPLLKALNIVALTSSDDPIPAIKAGADIFIRKIDGPELLLAHLSRLRARQQENL